MNVAALHGICLVSAEHCLEQIAHNADSTPDPRLISVLAACGTACLACARGCHAGTCLPETLQSCHAACERALEVCNASDCAGGGQALLKQTISSIRRCEAATQAALI